MKSEAELNEKIGQVCEEFHGQLDDLYKAVGMMVVGQHYGWRVMRLVSPRSTWTLAGKLFGDPKEWMRERGRLAHKSVGLKIVDAVGDYWSFVRSGHVSTLSQEQRKAVM